MNLTEKILLAYLLLMNAVGFTIMFADKRRAKKDRWRIPEATLLLVCALGGSLGGWIGMYTFHHKTLKPKFYLGVPAILALQIVLATVTFLHLG